MVALGFGSAADAIAIWVTATGDEAGAFVEPHAARLRPAVSASPGIAMSLLSFIVLPFPVRRKPLISLCHRYATERASWHSEQNGREIGARWRGNQGLRSPNVILVGHSAISVRRAPRGRVIERASCAGFTLPGCGVVRRPRARRSAAPRPGCRGTARPADPAPWPRLTAPAKVTAELRSAVSALPTESLAFCASGRTSWWARKALAASPFLTGPPRQGSTSPPTSPQHSQRSALRHPPGAVPTAGRQTCRRLVA